MSAAPWAAVERRSAAVVSGETEKMSAATFTGVVSRGARRETEKMSAATFTGVVSKRAQRRRGDERGSVGHGREDERGRSRDGPHWRREGERGTLGHRREEEEERRSRQRRDEKMGATFYRCREQRAEKMSCGTVGTI